MKKLTIICLNLLTGLQMMLLLSFVQERDTAVKITGIRSNKGAVIISVYKDQESYRKEQPFKKMSFEKKNIRNGSLQLMLYLQPGVYGITLIDDENSNGKIDKNLIGMPKEGFGFSNFNLEKMQKPSFDDFRVDLNGNQGISVRVKYM